jgi:hypothetical protein
MKKLLILILAIIIASCAEDQSGLTNKRIKEDITNRIGDGYILQSKFGEKVDIYYGYFENENSDSCDKMILIDEFSFATHPPLNGKLAYIKKADELNPEVIVADIFNLNNGNIPKIDRFKLLVNGDPYQVTWINETNLAVLAFDANESQSKLSKINIQDGEQELLWQGNHNESMMLVNNERIYLGISTHNSPNENIGNIVQINPNTNDIKTLIEDVFISEDRFEPYQINDSGEIIYFLEGQNNQSQINSFDIQSENVNLTAVTSNDYYIGGNYIFYQNEDALYSFDLETGDKELIISTFELDGDFIITDFNVKNNTVVGLNLTESTNLFRAIEVDIETGDIQMVTFFGVFASYFELKSIFKVFYI